MQAIRRESDTGSQALRRRGRLLHPGAPLARYGLFVMNSQREAIDAFQNYQDARIGGNTQTARVG